MYGLTTTALSFIPKITVGSPHLPPDFSDSMKTFVLVGGAFPPEVAERYPIVSAAAARWQYSFMEAVAREFGVRFLSLGFLPVGSERVKPWEETRGDVVFRALPRDESVAGTIRYFLRALAAVIGARKSTSCVFCYNALIWTAPFAYILGWLAKAPVIMLVADLDPVGKMSRRSFKGLVERVLLRGGKRFIVFSPEALKTLPASAKKAVFSGIADEHALSLPPVRYEDKVRFVYAGRVSAEGGADIFFNAALKVAGERKDVAFDLFGRGTLDVPLPLDLDAQISFHGFVAESALDEFLGRGCVGVNPRPQMGGLNQHNAPYKLLYYLSRGMTTITTVTDGVPEELAKLCVIAEDGVQGLADAMRKVLAMSPQERAEMGENARRVLRETRSPKVLAAIVRALTN
jgi:glycosyltransferase involved in cell wall biosynthesis